MSNIRDVARIAGVSVATVSRALSAPEKVSNESLAKVKTAIAQVGYRPNMLARTPVRASGSFDRTCTETEESHGPPFDFEFVAG